jgi:hypothetical protein
MPRLFLSTTKSTMGPPGPARRREGLAFPVEPPAAATAALRAWFANVTTAGAEGVSWPSGGEGEEARLDGPLLGFDSGSGQLRYVAVRVRAALSEHARGAPLREGAPLWQSFLAGISLCHACSGHEIEDCGGRFG